MTRLAKSLIAVAAVVIALSGCKKDTPDSIPLEERTKSVTLIAGPRLENQSSTRTGIAVIGDYYHVNWVGDETMNFYYDGESDDQIKPAMNVLEGTEGKANKASFSMTVPESTVEISGFVGAECNPESQYKLSDGTVSGFGIKLPEIQNITESSFDKNSDALIMTPVNISNSPSNVTLNTSFKRVFAITKLEFTGLDSYSKDIVRSVKFESKNNELTGGVTVNYNNAGFINNETGKEITEGSVITNAPKKYVKMKYPTSTTLGDANFSVWMVTVPVDFNGDVITITIETDKNIFTKTIKLNQECKILTTQPNIIEINMSNATVSLPGNPFTELKNIGFYKFSGETITDIIEYKRFKSQYMMADPFDGFRSFAILNPKDEYLFVDKIPLNPIVGNETTLEIKQNYSSKEAAEFELNCRLFKQSVDTLWFYDENLSEGIILKVK